MGRFLALNTGDSVSDGSEDNTYVARAFIYLPFYVTGYLGKRHRLFDRYLQFARKHVLIATIVRLLSIGYMFGLFYCAVHTKRSIYWQAGLSGEGCASGTPLTQLPTGPALDRWHHIGCIFGYQPLLWINLIAILLAVPYEHVTFATLAGSRTLGAYCFMQAQWSTTALVLRGIAAWGKWGHHNLTIPDSWSVAFFIVFPALFVIFLCSETFFYIVSPLMAPTWALRLFDADTDPSASTWRPSSRWVCAFFGFGFFMNFVAATNGR